MLPLGSLRKRGNRPELGPDEDHLYAVFGTTPNSRQKSARDIHSCRYPGRFAVVVAARRVVALPLIMTLQRGDEKGQQDHD